MDLLNTLLVWNFLLVMVAISSIRWAIWPYLIYPGLIRIAHRLKGPRATPTAFEVPESTNWPRVDLVFAAFNEEAVLEEKLKSIQNFAYPQDKLTVWIGSDCSTDATEDILARTATTMPNLRWERMPQRSGKSRIINHLVAKGSGEVIVGTDANIFFHPMALQHMVAPLLLRQDVALVGGELTYRGLNEGDTYKSIAQEEKSYIGWENRTKVCEGELLGMTMGVEGGCYALRRAFFAPIPPGTYMEDFFLTMQVLQRGYKVMHAELATCTEDVSNDARMEYRRKVRISHGNWQNTVRIFKHLASSKGAGPSRERVGWGSSMALVLVFVGHKLMRWLLPVVAAATFILQLGFGMYYHEWRLLAVNLATFGGLTVLVLYPAKFFPRSLARRIKPLSYFIWMNIALLQGLWQFLRTPSHAAGVWQPTKRNNQ